MASPPVAAQKPRAMPAKATRPQRRSADGEEADGNPADAEPTHGETTDRHEHADGDVTDGDPSHRRTQLRTIRTSGADMDQRQTKKRPGAPVLKGLPGRGAAGGGLGTAPVRLCLEEPEMGPLETYNDDRQRRSIQDRRARQQRDGQCLVILPEPVLERYRHAPNGEKAGDERKHPLRVAANQFQLFSRLRVVQARLDPEPRAETADVFCVVPQKSPRNPVTFPPPPTTSSVL